MVIINRNIDLAKLESLGNNLLVYGRRKTGKTFLIKRHFKGAPYFFVKRSGTIFYEERGEDIMYESLLLILDNLIKENKLFIIDEFQRLPEDFFDYLHAKSPQKAVLVTSTLNLARKILKSKSPILGLFKEFQLDLIDERDILLGLKPLKENLVEYAVYLREPILLTSFDKNLFETIKSFKLTVPTLVGEIFKEEEKTLGKKYEGILRAVASGKSRVSEIADFLYSRKLIDKSEHGNVTSYIDILVKLGLIKRIGEYKGNRYYYFLHSPMLDLYYYLDEKYNFSEEDLDEKYFYEKMSFHVEDFFRNLLSKLFKMKLFAINKPDLEVDIALGDFKSLKIVGEVKWKKRIKKEEIDRIEEKMKPFACRKFLIVPDRKSLEKIPQAIEVLDPNNILSLILKNK